MRPEAWSDADAIASTRAIRMLRTASVEYMKVPTISLYKQQVTTQRFALSVIACSSAFPASITHPIEDGHGKEMGSTNGRSGEGGLSSRGFANVDTILPKIKAAVTERVKIDNPSIDLASAENWLLRDELTALCKEAISRDLQPLHFSYPRAFAGYPEVLKAFAAFFNRYFNPHKLVEESHLATAPGAATCLDTILYNICDPGDGVLMPSPYWSGFDFQFQARSSAVPIAVPVSPLLDCMTKSLIPALEEAFTKARVPIRGLLLCNPQNPLGLCYPAEVIIECMLFCERKGIHYISDEVYALTSFQAHDLPKPVPFVSALSFDLDKVGIKPSRVHTFWSTSKDFGQSGIRMGNQEMAVGLALASNTQTSSLSAVFVAALLNSPDLDSLITLNSRRLAENYATLTSTLTKLSISYIPCNAGLYVYARIVKHKPAEAIIWEDESSAVAAAKQAGVLLSSGRGYHGHESDRGWARIGFAVQPQILYEACERLEKAFG